MLNAPAPKKRQNAASFWAAFAAVFLVCLLTLYAGENRGVSDNGDFRRVMLVNNLSYENEPGSAYLFKQYYTMKLEGDTLWQKAASLFDTTMEGELYSSPHFVAIKASKLLNFGYNLATQRPLGSYNICFLALIYIFLLALAGGLTVRFFGRFGAAWQIGAAVLFLFIFCDAGYVLYFNSLYGEPLQYVCLLLCIALGLTFYQNPKNLLSIAAFFVSLYFFAGAKLANIPFALLCCLASVAWLWRIKGKWKKAALLVLVVAATASLGVLYKSIPAWMDYDTTYQAVFFGILKESPTPKADVKSLGLPEEYADLAGTHAYMQSYPLNTKDAAFTQSFYETTGKADVVGFYLTHPVRFVQKLSVAVRNSAHIRPAYLGTSPSVPMSQQARFSLWSDLRIASRFLYHPFLVLPALLLLALGAAFWLFNAVKKRKNMVLPLFALLFMAGTWFSLVIPICGNGEADLEKHMFLFISFMDVLFFMGLLLFAKSLPSLWQLLWRHKKTACCGLLACVLAFGAAFWAFRRPTVYFGAFEGKPLCWEVVAENDKTQTLLLKTPLSPRAFDENGSGRWKDSSLRAWLNGPFLEAFSSQEAARLVPAAHKVLLSAQNLEDAAGGSHPHFWTSEPHSVFSLGESAYFEPAYDQVRLLGLEEYQNLSFSKAASRPYWLADPYTANNTMVRYSQKGGFVLHQEAANPLYVRPVITINKQ